MLSVDDELPTRPQRVLVAGVSGVGKSTVARRLGSMLDVPYTEIDGLFHGENWIPRPGFLDDVRALIGHDGWVTEWQYASARGMLADRADLLVWLDLPFRVTFTRALRRTVSRRVRREVLWNGNVSARTMGASDSSVRADYPCQHRLEVPLTGRIGKPVRIRHRARCGDPGPDLGSPKTGLEAAGGRNPCPSSHGRSSGSPLCHSTTPSAPSSDPTTWHSP